MGFIHYHGALHDGSQAMRLSLITVMLILAIFTFVVVAGFSLFNTGPRRVSARLLAAFLIALSVALLNFLYIVGGWVETDPHFAFLGNSLGLAAAPLLYLYACSLAVSGFRLHPASILHFAPVFALVALILVVYTFEPTDIERAILHDNRYPSVLNATLLQALVFAYVFAYLFLSVRVLFRHRRLYKQQQASTGLAELTWLRVSLVGTLLMAVTGLLHQLLVRRWPLVWLDSVFVAIQAMAAFALGFYFLIQALRQSAQAPAPVILSAAVEDKYGPHRLSDTELLAHAQQIETHLKTHGAHLRGSISIGDLAEQLPMSARDLSQTLNRHFQLSFFDYINRHRCEHAKRLLAERGNATVIEIQLESGFSSKSSFHAAFKKCTGMTPVEYRRRLRLAEGAEQGTDS
jgi:AraC-like DNA-binding protein